MEGHLEQTVRSENTVQSGRGISASGELFSPQRQAQSSGFHYSKRLNCYVARGPLKVDDRVVRAAAGAGVTLQWDDEGRICNISFNEAKQLLTALGSSMLSPAEYWELFREAEAAGDTELLQQIQSNSCAEWLDAVFLRRSNGEVALIEHPELECREDSLTIEGEQKVIEQPYARPGWFNPQSGTDAETGLPEKVETQRAKGSPSWSDTTWKYWSTFQIDQPVAAIRGYVTSSGTPSLDLDIPVAARNPVLMVRECREQLPAPGLDSRISAAARPLVLGYQTTLSDRPAGQNGKAHALFYEERFRLFDLLDRCGSTIFGSDVREARQLQEQLIDMLGVLRLEAQRRGDTGAGQEIERHIERLFPRLPKTLAVDALKSYLTASRERLQDALAAGRKVVCVMGHSNPDTDTAVSSLFEAWRNQLADPAAVYVPVLQAARLPDEIRRLLGEALSAGFICSSEDIYQRVKDSGVARWILVDHNSSEQQRFAVSIVDHHILSATAERQEVSKSWEMAGSCAAMIAQKLSGMGFTPDSGCARILLGACLMDTENRSRKKMTYRDKLIMDHLAALAEVPDEKGFFQDLMSHLLNTGDAERLFERDYKQDWGIFGFAVAKVKNVFSADGSERKPELLRRLTELAQGNNRRKNLALTVVKVVDYEADNERVNRERVCLVFNEHALPEFRAAVYEYFETVIRHEFGAQVKLRRFGEGIEFWGVGDQLSRKAVAPELGRLVEAFNQYLFSPALGHYVSREFLKATPEVQQAAQECGIELFQDGAGRVVNITYHEAKRLLERLKMKMLSLPEYWRLYREVRTINDAQMQEHLQSAGFVELLDTVVLDNRELVHHPALERDGDGFKYLGEHVSTEVPEALPGLIQTSEIDPGTGLPALVHSPQQYDDRRMWRYWSPDSPVCIPTRGHIFLLGQPALDLKIHPDDALQNMGVRPCVDQVELPAIRMVETERGVKVERWSAGVPAR